MKQKKIDIFLVPILIISGKLLSFVFNALLGSYYGAGKISDAFIMAHSIPTVLFEGGATAFISCYIPIQRTLKHNSPDRIDNFNSNMTSISVLLSIVITVIYFIFRHQINRVYAHGFDEVSLGLLDKYSSVLVCSIPVIGTYSILRAHLQVSGKKTVSSIGQIITYIVLTAALLIFYPNDDALAWATLAGNILCFAVFAAYAFNTGYRYRPYFSLKEDYIKTLLVMIFPVFFSTLASEFASIVDKYFASHYSDGIITSLTYGYQLSFAMQGIVSTSLLIIIFPSLSDKAALGDYDGMNSLMYKSVEIISWIILPIVVGGVILAKPIISILFGHGKFAEESVNITAIVFAGYLFGVFPMCVKHICDRVSFALKKTRIAMITTFVTVGMNVVLDILMSMVWGYMGLVIATGLSILAGTITSLYMLKKEKMGLKLRGIVGVVSRPLAASFLMGMVVYPASKFVLSATSNPMNLIGSFLIGVVAYGAIAILLFKDRILSILETLRK